MASRSESDLHPDLLERWHRMKAIMAAAGRQVFLTCTLRSPSEQDIEFAKGRTTPGRRVTNARAWESYHQPWVDEKSLAFDFAFRPEGNSTGVDWNGPWEFAGVVAEFVGLEWGGRWSRRPDRPHCQLTLGRTIAQLQTETGHV